MPLDRIAMCIPKRACIVCGKQYRPKQDHQKYCSRICRKSQEKNNSKSSLNHISQSKIGSVSELEMCAHYLREGYEVFRNVSPDGPIDIIIFNAKTKELHLIDIKSYVRSTSSNSYVSTEESKTDLDVKVVPYDYNIKEPLRTLSVPSESPVRCL